jgi:hypothetical protein
LFEGCFASTANVWSVTRSGWARVLSLAATSSKNRLRLCDSVTCVATWMFGGGRTVVSVAFHPTVPVLTTGIDKGTVPVGLWLLSSDHSSATCVATLAGRTCVGSHLSDSRSTLRRRFWQPAAGTNCGAKAPSFSFHVLSFFLSKQFFVETVEDFCSAFAPLQLQCVRYYISHLLQSNQRVQWIRIQSPQIGAIISPPHEVEEEEERGKVKCIYKRCKCFVRRCVWNQVLVRILRAVHVGVARHKIEMLQFRYCFPSSPPPPDGPRPRAQRVH